MEENDFVMELGYETLAESGKPFFSESGTALPHLSPIPMRNLVCIVLLVSAVTILAPHAFAAEPGWSPVIIATGSYRKQIEATPIEQRPYRPFHFYGNTVRRMHYRGNPLPLPRGLSQAMNPAPLLGSFRRFR